MSLLKKYENLTSQIDGVTATFTIAETFVTGSVLVIHNGTVLLPGSDFTETANGFTLQFVPISGDTLQALYDFDDGFGSVVASGIDPTI